MTDLEKYLKERYTAETIQISQKIAIVGTDKEGFSPLLTLYEKLSDQNPNCLSAYLLKEKEPKWTKPLNDLWLKQTLAIEILDTFYIAHPAINDALKIASAEGQVKVNLKTFSKNYKGYKNDSYDEVLSLINAQFVNFEESKIPIAGNDFAGILTRNNF